MSIPSLCNACWRGMHEMHDRDWNIRPGLIGGAYCPCAGDCAERQDPAAVELLRRIFGASPGDEGES